MKLFLDRRPLSTCAEESCSGCDMHGKIICHFNAKRLTLFLCFGLSLLILGGCALYMTAIWLFVLWLAFALAFFGFIEIRVLCAHCPHYAEPSLKSLKCWANYGSPKLWKYRPGPQSSAEKAVFITGVLLIFLMPLPAMLMVESLWMFCLYAALLAAGIFVMRNFYCSRCMNFACPFNKVKNDVRTRFISHNPGAWKNT